MTSNPYTLTDGIAVLPRGRKQIVERLVADLSRASAPHLSIVGPPMIGKSPVLVTLAQTLQGGRDGYVTSVYWDLSHKTPATDDEFKEGLAAKIRRVLVDVLPDLAEQVSLDGPAVLDNLALVLDELATKKARILVVLDEMDSLFRAANLSRNLWDNLLDLARKKSLRLATGSRARLRELCRSEDSRTSDFWELFPNPVHLGPLSSDQINEASADLAKVRVRLDQSGAKEIRQWTGGHPALVGCFMECLCERFSDAELRSEHVRDMAGDVFKRSRDILDAVWEDLPVEDQMVMLSLANGDVDASRLQRASIARLAERGLGEEVGNRVSSTARFTAQYAKEHGPSVDRIATLFSDRKSYLAHIKPTLELRLKQIPGGDADLRGFIERALRDLYPDPSFSLSWARNIATRTLQVIWGRESPDGKTIPPEWLTAWKSNVASHQLQRLVGDYANNTRIPQEGGQQLRLLRFATGAEQVPGEAKHLTKPAFELLDFVHSVGDYGQHKNDPATQGVATAFCHAAVELFAALHESVE